MPRYSCGRHFAVPACHNFTACPNRSLASDTLRKRRSNYRGRIIIVARAAEGFRRVSDAKDLRQLSGTSTAAKRTHSISGGRPNPAPCVRGRGGGISPGNLQPPGPEDIDNPIASGGVSGGYPAASTSWGKTRQKKTLPHIPRIKKAGQCPAFFMNSNRSYSAAVCSGWSSSCTIAIGAESPARKPVFRIRR